MAGAPVRWVCPNCGANNMLESAACFRCRTPRPTAQTARVAAPAPAAPVSSPPVAPVPPKLELVVPASPEQAARERRVDRWYRYVGITAKRKEAWSRDGSADLLLIIGPLFMAAIGLGCLGGLLRVIFLEPQHFRPDLLWTVLLIPLLPWGLALLAAYAQATWKRCIIFREVPLADEANVAAAGIKDVVITVLARGVARDLYGLPCVAGRDPNGDYTFSQHIDTSTFTMGIRLVDGRQYWTFRLAPGTYRITSVGLQYWGKTVRPAMRISVLGDDAPYDRAVISCGSVAEFRLLEKCLRPYEAPR